MSEYDHDGMSSAFNSGICGGSRPADHLNYEKQAKYDEGVRSGENSRKMWGEVFSPTTSSDSSSQSYTSSGSSWGGDTNEAVVRKKHNPDYTGNICPIVREIWNIPTPEEMKVIEEKARAEREADRKLLMEVEARRAAARPPFYRSASPIALLFRGIEKALLIAFAAGCLYAITDLAPCKGEGSLACEKAKVLTKVGSFVEGLWGSLPSEVTHRSFYEAGAQLAGRDITLQGAPYLVEVDFPTRVKWEGKETGVPVGTRFMAWPKTWNAETGRVENKINVQTSGMQNKAFFSTRVHLVPPSDVGADRGESGQKILARMAAQGNNKNAIKPKAW